jgi:hypothetical protein
MKPRQAMLSEAGIWAMALIALALYSPHTEAHVSICPIAAMDWGYCPGCGLGRSMSLVLHGQFAASLAMHPLGIFAVIVLVYRIIRLISKSQKLNPPPNP